MKITEHLTGTLDSIVTVWENKQLIFSAILDVVTKKYDFKAPNADIELALAEEHRAVASYF
jgi:hypothetical protein